MNAYKPKYPAKTEVTHEQEVALTHELIPEETRRRLLANTQPIKKSSEEPETEKELEPPLYALLISPDHQMRVNILYGVKTITIRSGWRDYKPNTTVVLCCHLAPWAVMADIIDVRRCLVSEVTEEEYGADGFDTQEDMLTGMQKYYPYLTLGSPVTIIHWDNVRGFLADNKSRYALGPNSLYVEIEHNN